jgi:transcription elongation factor SPT6
LQGYGIQPHDVVLNFFAQHHTQFVDDQELNPIAYAEQFADPDVSKAQSPEELLARARMILATELGKDPLLRQEMRETFRENAQISILPTERGLNKIDLHHPYFVSIGARAYGKYKADLFVSQQNFKYLYHKNVKDMLETPQFLHILAAEAEHLITVSIFLPPDAKADFERRLSDAFSSDSFSDTAKAWNEERSSVVQETLEYHLIPVGAKWVREWLREEVEDFLAARCAEDLREVVRSPSELCHV